MRLKKAASWRPEPSRRGERPSTSSERKPVMSLKAGLTLTMRRLESVTKIPLWLASNTLSASSSCSWSCWLRVTSWA